MRLAVYVADFDPAADTLDRKIDASRQLEYDLVVYLNPLPALFSLIATTDHEAVAGLFNFDLVMLEVSTGACRTDDSDFSGGSIPSGDFYGATNARDFNARSRRELVRLVDLVALLEVAVLRRRGRTAGQHNHARKQCGNKHILHLSWRHNILERLDNRHRRAHLNDTLLCVKSRTSGLDTVSTGSGSDLVNDQHRYFLMIRGSH